MGVLSRFAKIMESNINAMLDKAEDPAKMVDQTLLDLRRDLAVVKEETAGVMANEKSAQRQVDECKKDIATLNNAAMNAVKSGNDDDARKLLAQKEQKEATLVGLQENLTVATDNALKMRQMYDKLTADIQSLENRKASIKAKVATAKAQEHVNKATANIKDSSASMAAFDRMETKANQMLDKANAGAELNAAASADNDLMKKYAYGSSASVEDELAKMKAELGIS